MSRNFAASSLFAILLIGLVGCGQKESSQPSLPAEPSSVSQNTTAKKVVDAATAATLKGKVLFEGQVPPVEGLPIRGNPECATFHPDGMIHSEALLVNGGAVQNVFVYVKEGLEALSFEVPTAPVVISNRQCVYAPHVVGVQVGQPVELLNEDPTLHNVHSYAKALKTWNLGLPFQGMKQTKKFEAPEVMVTLKCDVHPWMIGFVGVLPHPYFGVTDASGEFELKNLPPGDYVIEAWHEKLGAQSQKITIGPRETKEIQFTFIS